MESIKTAAHSQKSRPQVSLRKLAKERVVSNFGAEYQRVQVNKDYMIGKAEQTGAYIESGNLKMGQSKYLPISEVFTDVEVQESIAVIKMVHEYYFPSVDGADPQEKPKADAESKEEVKAGEEAKVEESKSVEVTFKFPKEENSVISKMLITLGDKTIEAKVMEKEQAEEKYEDAISAGNMAALLSEKNEDADMYEVNIGQVLPGQTVIVEMMMIQPLAIVGGAYHLILPLSYYPKSLIQDQESKNYNDQANKGSLFNLRVNIQSKEQISHISHPNYCETLEQSQNNVVIQQIASPFNSLEKDIKIFYKTQNMDKPKFFYQNCESKYPGYVAVMAQFLPTFDSKDEAETTQGEGQSNAETAGASESDSKVETNIQYQNDGEEIEETDINEKIDEGEAQYCFYFIVDRSGSMGGSRIELAKDAMKLFLSSLPPNCKFHIVSFGSEFQHIGVNQKCGNPNSYQASPAYDLTDANIKYCKDEVSQFSANFGGTQIYQPLEYVFKESNDMRKRIFLLTDGQVNNEAGVLNLIGQNCQNDGVNKVFSFGIGSGCSHSLVKGSAKQGKGDYTFVEDSNLEAIKAKVINMLQKASEPALLDCSFQFMPKTEFNPTSFFDPSESFELGQMFRNQYVQQYTIMTQEQFDNNLAACFKSEFDPKSKKAISTTYAKDQFINITPAVEGDGERDPQSLEEDDDLGQFENHLFDLAAKKKIDALLNQQQQATYGYTQIQLVKKISTKYQVLCKETAFVGVVKQRKKAAREMERIDLQPAYAQMNNMKSSLNVGQHMAVKSQKCRRTQAKQQYSQMQSQSYQGGYQQAQMRSMPMQAMSMRSSRPVARGMAMQAPPMQQMNMAAPMQMQAPMQMKAMKMEMQDSLNSMLERGGKIEEANIKSSQIQASSMSFKSKAAKKSSGGVFSSIGGLFSKGKSAKPQPPAAKAAKSSMKASMAKSSIKESMMAQEESTSYGGMMQQESMSQMAGPQENEMDQQLQQLQELEQMMQQQAVDDQAEKAKLASDSSFNALINSQSIDGYWKAESKGDIYKFLDAKQQAVIDEFLAYVSKEDKTKVCAQLILTILAMDIFSKRFQHKREEWRMIGRNVTRWIHQARSQLSPIKIKDLEQKVADTEKAIKAMEYTTQV